jgi:hypothetical protein
LACSLISFFAILLLAMCLPSRLMVQVRVN